MRILVVGGAGFIGSHLVDRLLAEDHLVDVVDDLSTGSLANLAAARAAHVGALKIHNLDLRVPELGDLLARLRPDVAVHLALPGPGPAPDLLARALGGTANLLEGAVGAGTSKIVVGLHGPSYYGQVSPRDLPVKEGGLGSVLSPATIAQRAVADLLALYRERRSLEYTALALGTVYGPRQRPDGGVVAAFTAARRAGRAGVIDGDGRQTRDLVAIDDTVDALERATTRGTGLIVNVGTGVQTSVNDLYEAVFALPAPSASRGAARPDEIGRFALSPVRARIHLAWAPWTDLPTGLAGLLAQSSPAEAATGSGAERPAEAGEP
jgi:UDP-glucose 4-epimerase